VNSVTTNFVYRGDGLRDSRAISGGATTTFTWDIASGLPVVLDDGNQYVYGSGLTSMKQGGSWYHYLADGLGSTMAVVDASGVSQKSYQYDVYGEAMPSGGLANEFDFAGQQTDGTGLQYLRARYMDMETGTFLSRDRSLPGRDRCRTDLGTPGRIQQTLSIQLGFAAGATPRAARPRSRLRRKRQAAR
jgi:RHS repeat-associated protein